jgi:endonuclease/exonuclease/phosphatase family metal-dependent hydrolase
VRVEPVIQPAIAQWSRVVAILLLTTTSGAAAARPGSAQTVPFSGNPVDLPGTIRAEEFDEGGEGVAYHDTTPGNSGGAYRETDVDIESSSIGGYNVGWITPGEWLNYTVNVTAPGNYTAQLQVASVDGGLMHVGFNGPSPVWTSVTIPSTGGWQEWRSVSIPVTLGAGVQQLTLLFDSGATNLNSVNIAPGGGGEPDPGNVVVVTWNIDSVEPGNGTPEFARAAMDHIVAMSPLPQIVIVQEAFRSQFDTYIDELQNRTGLTWRGVFGTHCAPWSWIGVSCIREQDEGVGIFSSLPIVDAASTYLPFPDDWHSARVAVRAAVDVNGRVVQVFGAHLSNTTWARHAMMGELMVYAQQFSSPQIVGGDFNADPDQIVDAPGSMGVAFRHVWSMVGSGPGYTADTPSPTMHLDYWFSDFSGLIQPAWAVY